MRLEYFEFIAAQRWSSFLPDCFNMAPIWLKLSLKFLQANDPIPYLVCWPEKNYCALWWIPFRDLINMHPLVEIIMTWLFKIEIEIFYGSALCYLEIMQKNRHKMAIHISSFSIYLACFKNSKIECGKFLKLRSWSIFWVLH